jgi:8-oxo-dGTP diphosphatase
MSDERTKIIPVLAAIIFNNKNDILIAKRKSFLSRGNLWEFPGGKLMVGESLEECLTREVKEELGIHIKVKKLWHAINYSYPDKNIVLLAYLAIYVKGVLSLSDHSQVKWVSVPNLNLVKFSEADIPLVHKLMDEKFNMDQLK